MTKAVRYILVAAALIASVGLFYWFRTTSLPNSQEGARKLPAADLRIQATVARAQNFSEALLLSGEVMPAEKVDVYPERMGRIVSVNFTEGSSVKQGEVLFVLDDVEERAQVQRLQAQFVIDSAQQHRLESLKKVDGVSMQDLDAARAQVKVRRAEIEQAASALEKTRIRAPFAGKVGLRMVSVGAVIGPQTLLTTVADVRTLKVDVPVPDRYAYAVTPGTRLSCIVHTNVGADTVIAVVYASDPAADQNTRTLRVRARLTSAEAKVVPGTIVDVVVNTSTIPNAIMVPSEAIQQGMKGASVFVIEHGLSKEVPVLLGGRTADRVHVLSGLSAGDTVAISGLMVLKNGMPATALISN